MLSDKTIGELSRRDFVQRTLRGAAAGAVAAGIAAAGTPGTGLAASGTMPSSLAIARAAHPAGSDVIRLGMIGCGGRCAGAAAEALASDPGTRLVAMSDLFADRVQGKRRALKAKYPEQVVVDDEHCFVGLDGYRKVIESADVVLIACAAKFHPLYVKAAIEAGRHVFCEKPHAIDPLGIKVLNAACEQAKEKKLGVLSGLQSRFHPAIRETIQRVIDGQIGEIISIEENWLRGPYGNTSRPKNMRELEIQYGNQYRFSWLCGDDVTQTLVHNIDRATWAMKETPPARCWGMGGRSSSQHLLGDVFDHHAVVYQYANGVRLYAHCRTTLGCYNENISTIFGTNGVAYPMGGRITGVTPWNYQGPSENPYLAEQREFLKSIRAGKPLYCGDYMARSTLICIMGQLSCYSGKMVTWEQVCNSDYSLGPRPEDCTWDMEPPTRPDDQGIYPVCATPGMTKNV